MQFNKFWKRSIVNKLLVILPFIWILLAIVFAFYDLEISKFLFNSESSVGKLVEFFGEIPGIFFAIFALFVLNTNAKIKNKNYRKLFFLFQILLSSFLFIYSLNLIFDYFNINFSFLSLEGISVFLIFTLISLGGFYLFKIKFSKFSKKNYLFAKLSVILFILSGFIIQVLKFLGGRIRFADLAIDFSDFTPWFVFNGFTGSSSFPSGHAFFAWILIPLFLIFPKKGYLRIATLILSFLFGIFISTFRVVSGAHFASDVLFSGGITLTLFLILYKTNFSNKYNLSTANKKIVKKRKQ
ncbi:hypothetical protein COU58_01215 [Candidatus Pacearchaeota archaeon CG10_big_fil_rev_8_21_14_0_10_32_42]|nr:MAG: hypothetical protein COU58_01215 [Candidatus Pacearchaeota archaeon CG10_big_fil_rev_8_21_14_0_10_32_42]